MLEVADLLQCTGADCVRNLSGSWPHQREDRISFGLVGYCNTFVVFQMAPQPGQITLDGSGTDIKPIAVVRYPQRGQIALKAAPFVEHCGVNCPSGWTRHVVGADSIQERFRIPALDTNFPERRLIE